MVMKKIRHGIQTQPIHVIVGLEKYANLDLRGSKKCAKEVEEWNITKRIFQIKPAAVEEKMSVKYKLANMIAGMVRTRMGEIRAAYILVRGKQLCKTRFTKTSVGDPVVLLLSPLRPSLTIKAIFTAQHHASPTAKRALFMTGLGFVGVNKPNDSVATQT
ncbi:hypothetical protein V2G26_005241 [Clonostachys chloroleuca]